MGLFGSSTPAKPPPTLESLGRPIGVIPTFTKHQQQMALKVRERKMSFSSDDYSIKDAGTGQKVFEVDGKAFSLHSKKVLNDAYGQPVFMLKKALMSLHTSYDGIDANGQTLFNIKSKFGFGANLKVTFRNLAGAGEEMELHIKGDWFDRKASITTAQGIPVAHISRSFMNAGQLLWDQQTYFVTIAPGVDAALMVAACICLDESENDK
ncbi:DUF567-domain-containing protein [Tilletiaria anomala UBC 951]|uniref:DUF567-domain-containing protein n=1 Tax=Tilletiaria anomala (strain ATCC 24038 / CBS 436.72 / UBC 951) TaxID=1037660 RepID=A0A066WM01_TILAU|nr:DUF567-domain-containing protein [Tilletiaria anomala UBC 951]KDN52029.1 DUF567-domain-containing protein [Tilletiaria anomala UBC 951]